MLGDCPLSWLLRTWSLRGASMRNSAERPIRRARWLGRDGVDDDRRDDPEDDEQRDPERDARAAARWRRGIEVGAVGGLVRDQVVAFQDLRLVLDLALHASV